MKQKPKQKSISPDAETVAWGCYVSSTLFKRRPMHLLSCEFHKIFLENLWVAASADSKVHLLGNAGLWSLLLY